MSDASNPPQPKADGPRAGRRGWVWKTLFLLLLSGAMVLVGINSAISENFIFTAVQSTKRALLDKKVASGGDWALNDFGQLIAYPGKKELPQPEIGPKTMVAFVFGQSNAANIGGERYSADSDNILNYFDGKFYRAADPLLGSAGISGSPWTLMSNQLTAAGVFDRVILIPAAIGGTSVSRWRQGGNLYPMLEARLADARAHNLKVTHFLWHQGEADNPLQSGGMSMADYDQGMREIIALTKQYFPDSRFYVAAASLCYFRRPVSTELQKAQRQLTTIKGVYAGPDTDTIGMGDRYDGCHLSGRGIEKHARGWVDVLKAEVEN